MGLLVCVCVCACMCFRLSVLCLSVSLSVSLYLSASLSVSLSVSLSLSLSLSLLCMRAGRGPALTLLLQIPNASVYRKGDSDRPSDARCAPPSLPKIAGRGRYGLAHSHRQAYTRTRILSLSLSLSLSRFIAYAVVGQWARWAQERRQQEFAHGALPNPAPTCCCCCRCCCCCCAAVVVVIRVAVPHAADHASHACHCGPVYSQPRPGRFSLCTRTCACARACAWTKRHDQGATAGSAPEQADRGGYARAARPSLSGPPPVRLPRHVRVSVSVLYVCLCVRVFACLSLSLCVCVRVRFCALLCVHDYVYVLGMPMWTLSLSHG
jgi:hypothetical protein